VVLATFLAVACNDSTGPGGPPGTGGTSPDLSNMSVGAVRVLTLSQAAGGLTISATESQAQYAIVLANANVNSGGAARQYAANGDWLSSAAPVPSGNVLSASAAASRLTPAPVPNARFEARLRSLERAQLVLPGAAHAGAVGSGPVVARSLLPPVPRRNVPAVGATLQLRVLTPAAFNGQGNICGTNSYVTTTGQVMVVSQHAIVVSDVNSPSGGFTSADFQSIANEFDTMIYPTDSAYFGAPTDEDQNGHIIIYYTPAVNQMTPAGVAGTTGYVGGFFFAGDLYPQSAPPAGCYSSNQGEIFYLLAPDPSGVYGNDFSVSFVRDVTRGTVAHELQHMINSGNRYVKNVPAFEATWLDEGLAHFAEDAVGRAEAGFGDQQKVDFNALTSLPQETQNAFFLQNLARAKDYVERPDTAGPISSSTRAGADLAVRGAAWTLLRYVADWFSGNDPRIVTRKLVAGPDTGTVNLPRSAGVPMDTILAHWLVTLYTDNRGIPGLPAQYNYKSYTMRQLLTGTLGSGQTQPSYLPVTSIGSGTTSVSVTVPGSSGAYFLTTGTTGGARTIRFTNPAGGTATDPGNVMRVYIVRVQ